MKKLIVLVAILALFAAACGGSNEASNTLAAEIPSQEELDRQAAATKAAKEAAEEKAKNFQELQALWTKIQAGPPTTPDWKAELDGQSSENSVLCQVVWFERAIRDFNYHRGKATPEELKQIGFTESLLAEQKRSRAARFATLAFENAKEGRTIDCPEAGSYEPYDLVSYAITDMKQYDIEPKELGLDVAGIRAIELAAIKSSAAELRKTMYEPSGEGGGTGRHVFLGALDKGFSSSDLGLTEEEIQKMQEIDQNG